MFYSRSNLHIASLNGHTNIVQYLLSHWEDVDVVDNDMNTPLTLASYKGHVDVVKLLLLHKANVNHKEKTG